MTSFCDCTSCARNDCGYCSSCRERNDDSCLFRKCRSVAYPSDLQIKWQEEAERLAEEYPQLKPLYYEVFVASDVSPINAGDFVDENENLRSFQQVTPSLKTHIEDETPINEGNDTTESSLATISQLNAASDSYENDRQQETSKCRKCGECSHCLRGGCDICSYCRNRNASYRNPCPFVICENFSYAKSTIKGMRNKAKRAFDENPDGLRDLYETLYGENSCIMQQYAQREEERKTLFQTMFGEIDSAHTEQRKIMLRSRFLSKPGFMSVAKKDNAVEGSTVLAVQSSGKRKRQTVCRECVGCVIEDCGLCIHCQGAGYGGTYKCAFRICHICDYAPRTLINMADYIKRSLEVTKRRDGSSPLDHLAKNAMIGPLASVAKCVTSWPRGVAKSLISKQVIGGTSSETDETSCNSFTLIKNDSKPATLGSQTAETRRISACRTCEGCRITKCGLCIHCIGLGHEARQRCVFQVCHRAVYEPSTVTKLAGDIKNTLNLTRRSDGSSPLDELAKFFLKGPLASYKEMIISLVQDYEASDEGTVTYSLRANSSNSRVPLKDGSRIATSDVSTVRKPLRACHECAGCTVRSCGLCIHCEGMGRYGRGSKCVFRICHQVDYAPRSLVRFTYDIQKSLDHIKEKYGSASLNTLVDLVMEGPLASYLQKVINVSSSDEESVAIAKGLEDKSNLVQKDEDSLFDDICKKSLGSPYPKYELLKGLNWNDDLGDWKEFVCGLKTLSDDERERAISFHYRQANELAVVTKRDHIETQKLERALIGSVLLLNGLPKKPKKTMVDKARHSILLYSLHFENDRRLMTMLTSNVNYQIELKQILNTCKVHELEPREFAKRIRGL